MIKNQALKFYFFIVICCLVVLGCTKQEDCYCNVGDGEYSYLPTSANAQSSGTVKASGDLEEECKLQEVHLKTNSSESAYCEMK